MTLAADRLVVALDTDTLEAAETLVKKLAGTVGWFKVGKELFTLSGPEGVRRIRAAGARKIFLDLKYHDIPTTVRRAVKAAVLVGADMVNVHALGGTGMMTEAVKGRDEAVAQGANRCLLVAVTTLTSMTQQELMELGIDATPRMLAVHLARMAARCGLDGAVSSPQEAADIKGICGDRFVTVTPGVRPAWAAKNDQARVMTPGEALAKGCDYLVVGRPITASKDPAAAAQKILAEMASPASATQK
ncbi:MAG: orotidine-5'-phosphate decarboxylase [Nitrospinae bacterium]|nr:orotidine-5'-phosphate decarboxylase [Nitrospinota bacterium]